jgi:hypothetical protein
METDLRTGQGWKQYYSSLVLIQSPDSQEALSCIDTKSALKRRDPVGAQCLRPKHFRNLYIEFIMRI